LQFLPLDGASGMEAVLSIADRISEKAIEGRGGEKLILGQPLSVSFNFN